MAQPPWDDDQALLAELRAALTVVPAVPADFTAAARASLAWRTVDADLLLAELAFDSGYDEAVAVRSAPGSSPRMLVFDGGGYRVEAEVGDAGITGQVTPADSGKVSCQTAAGTFDETDVDDTGCFALRSPADGAVRLHVESDGRIIATSWINLT